MSDKLLGYQLVPVYESDFNGFKPQAATHCIISGKLISSAGFKDLIISREVFNFFVEDVKTRFMIMDRMQDHKDRERIMDFISSVNNKITEEEGEKYFKE
jgi:hypothetical protein